MVLIQYRAPDVFAFGRTLSTRNPYGFHEKANILLLQLMAGHSRPHRLMRVGIRDSRQQSTMLASVMTVKFSEKFPITQKQIITPAVTWTNPSQANKLNRSNMTQNDKTFALVSFIQIGVVRLLINLRPV
jgi:hypothetical protein